MDNFDENRVVVTSLRESMCVVNIEIYKLAYTISLNSELKKKKKKEKMLIMPWTDLDLMSCDYRMCKHFGVN